MSARDEIEEWARTASFPSPVRWGDVEAEILRKEFPAEGSLPGRLLHRAVMGLLYLLAGLLLYGAAVFGLVLVVLGTRALDGDAGAFLIGVAYLPFLGAIACSLMTWEAWRERRRRSTGDLVVPLVTATASLVAWFLLRGEPSADWLPLVTLVAAAAALLVFFLILGGSKGTRPGNGWSLNPGSKQPYLTARKEVVQILMQRHVVELDREQRQAMYAMPLGTWHELD